MAPAAWYDPIPGTLGLPLIGQTFLFYRDYTHQAARADRMFGRVFKARILGQISIGLLGAEANQFVLVDHADDFSNAEGWRTSIGDMFRGGLLMMDGAEHRRHRSIMAAAFQRHALADYYTAMEPIIARHVESWAQRSSFRFYDAVKELTLEVAARVFLGLELEADIQRVNRAFLALTHGSIALVRFAVPGLGFGRGLRARRDMEGFFRDVIAARRDDPGTNMLGRLMTAENEHGERLTDQEVINQVIFLMMAAHDTTTSTLASVFYELGRDAEWRRAVRAETLDVAEAGGLDFESLGELPRHDWVIKEALRLHTPLVVVPRRTVRAIEYGGFELPPGALVGVTPAYTHRMFDYWTDPDLFDPSRFSESRAEDKTAPCCYIPFGAGAHNCLGKIFAPMQAKMVMHEVLRQFEWTLPDDKVAYKQVPIQAPADGLPLTLEPIH